MKILLASLLMIFAFQVSFGQEKPKAEKLEDFGATNCCEFGNKIDFLFNTINDSNSESIGYIIIYSNQKTIKQALYFERLALGHIRFRGFDEKRISVVKKNSDENLRMEFWKIENGVNPPFTVQDELNISWLNNKKTYLFFDSKTDYSELCGDFGENKQFAELLRLDPTLRGHIVIFDNSSKGFQKRKKELLVELTGKSDVPPTKLKTFFIKIGKDVYPSHQFWLVPKKHQN